MKSLKDIEYVGWGFYSIVFVLLIAPCIYLAWNITYDNIANTYSRVALGALFAFVVAGFVTWPVNELLHRRNIRRQKAEQQQARKQKKKQGNK
jgi:1,4-dihydroxy-2-naphthoate octaprenyltransferase